MSVPKEGESLRGPRARADYAIDENGYGIWQKALGRGGYPGGRAHRLYWAAANGPIPAKHDVHHKCHVRACVNPDHLEAVPERDHDLQHFLKRGRGLLTLELIKEIRAEGRKPGVTLLATARKYEIGTATVQQYWANNRWGDLLDDEPVTRPALTCPECGVVFESSRRDKVFCCTRHQSRASARRRRAMGAKS
jgi:hypothetical protein